jgi:hypothetical protein
VLADGAQAAFAAGAVAELEGRGARWARGAGAGLGAELAVRGLLGDAAEGAEIWRRQGGTGCPLLKSSISSARESLGEGAEVMAFPDAWRLSGWLDRASLAAHFSRAAEGWPPDLASRGLRCAVAVCDLSRGANRWVELVETDTSEAPGIMQAAAAFPAGWGPVEAPCGGGAAILAGGVEAAGGIAVPPSTEPLSWDIVCGFPVPAVRRTGLGTSLLEQVQRRTEIAAAGLVSQLFESGAVPGGRLFAPTEQVYALWASREGAELGIEYPLPCERNGDLVLGLLEFGAFVVRASAHA